MDRHDDDPGSIGSGGLKTEREAYVGPWLPEPIVTHAPPDHDVDLAADLSIGVDPEAVLPLHLETEKAREDVVGERRIHVLVYTDASFDAPADGRAPARRSQQSLFLRRAPSRRSLRH